MIPSSLIVVTDRHGSARPLDDTVLAVLDGGARWIWFRDKDLETAARRDLALKLREVARRAGALLTVGADVDLAAFLEADGVHLVGSAGADDVADARRKLGKQTLVGVSAHSLADVREAAASGADYITLSPIFATASKPGYGPSLGLSAVREAAGLGVPVVALGGITADRAADCLAAGASAIAVMGGPMRASDPAGEVRHLLHAMRRAT